MAIGIVVVVVLVVLAALVVVVQNRLVARRNDVRDAWAGIDVQLVKRSELVPNLVEVVKGYAGHERETLEKVTAARAALDSATGVTAASAADLGLVGALRSVFALGEAYPDLKADQQFVELQHRLTRIEDDLASARRYYNGTVKRYEDQRLKFPAVVIAGALGFAPEPWFQAEEDARTAPSAKVVS